MRKTIVYITIILCIVSCSETQDGPYGATVISKRELLPYRTIQIYDIFDVYLKQDTACYVVIEAPEKLLQHIETRIDTTKRPGFLEIFNHSGYRWAGKYERIKITLHFVNISWLKNHEACYITTLDTLRLEKLDIYARAGLGEMDLTLDCNYLKFSTSYTTLGKYTLRGKADNLLLYIHNGSILDGKDMKASHALVYQNSVADVSVTAINTLDAEIWGKGNILLYGLPAEINVNKQGKGEIVRKP